MSRKCGLLSKHNRYTRFTTKNLRKVDSYRLVYKTRPYGTPKQPLFIIIRLRCYAENNIQPFGIDIAWSVSLSVCLLDRSVTCAKTTDPINVQFGMITQVDPRNHVLCGGLDSPTIRGDFLGGCFSHSNAL